VVPRDGPYKSVRWGPEVDTGIELSINQASKYSVVISSDVIGILTYTHLK
jgi:hypothetical protein